MNKRTSQFIFGGVSVAILAVVAIIGFIASQSPLSANQWVKSTVIGDANLTAMKSEEELYQIGLKTAQGLGLVGDATSIQTFLLSADYYQAWRGGSTSVNFSHLKANDPVYIVLIDGNYKNVRVSGIVDTTDIEFVGTEITMDATSGKVLRSGVRPSYASKPDYNVIPDYEARRRANEAAQAQQIAPEATAEALLDLPAAP